MQIIDSILDLAKTIEPARDDTAQEFSLTFKDNEWHAVVKMRLYYIDGKGETADEALQNLHKQVINFNQSLLTKITNKIKRWVSGPTNLKVIK